MRLITCENCGIVLNANFLSFPAKNEIYNDEGSIDTEKAVYYETIYYSNFVPKVDCPVCNSPIPDPNYCYD